MQTSSIKQAVDKVGGQRALAKLLGVSQQAVGDWIARDRVPAARVLQIEQVSGISRTALRPDLYPAEAAA